MNDDLLKMVRKVELEVGFKWCVNLIELERFAALVLANNPPQSSMAWQEGFEAGRMAEREAIMDEWWMCVQSDLENGVKSLNERAAEKWKKEYPAIAGFAATIEARGNT